MASKVVIGAVIMILLIIALVPVVVQFIADADRAVLECNDAGTPILNESLELCTNASGVGVVNATPTEAGLTSTQSSMLLLTITFIVLGVVVVIVRKTGLI